MASDSVIRILLVEDHETVRYGLRLLLERQPDMTVVGEACNGRIAIEQACALRPTVAVIDVSMPELNGVEATRAIAAEAPDVAVVALTRYSDDGYVQALLGAGACAYVLKQSASLELLNAIRAAAAGRRYLDTALSDRVADAFLARHAGSEPPRRISEREGEVLRLIAIGHSNKEIAHRLDLSVKTVEAHKANGMRKLNLGGRVDIVRFAIKEGWLRDA
jgi:DNA-binding NarL/FixJ family response regulator